MRKWQLLHHPKYKWFRRFFYFVTIWIIIHVAILLIDGIPDTDNNADVAIVLGNRVYSDGTLANWTRGRVDKAFDLYKSGQVKKIFVSGGLGKEDHYPEGTAMKAYLLSRGVPDSAVIADNAGANTYLTAVDFLRWNKDHHFSKVIVVSHYYHITRTKYILRKAGFEGKIFSASSDRFDWMDIIGTLREVPAFYKYALYY
ncbi:MAG: YdcF family protein [Chitinophagaceae bacterium]|nr:YdcF family protein [Chitinophagaceae bacterium]